MNKATFVMILTGVLLNAFAQLSIKAGTNMLGALSIVDGEILRTFLRVILNPYIAIGMACYVISVGIWIAVLSRVQVSVAYPMLSIGYVFNALAAWYLYGESLTLYKFAGIVVIILGVYLVAKS